jgi:hypothetical protein
MGTLSSGALDQRNRCLWTGVVEHKRGPGRPGTLDVDPYAVDAFAALGAYLDIEPGRVRDPVDYCCPAELDPGVAYGDLDNGAEQV